MKRLNLSIFSISLLLSSMLHTGCRERERGEYVIGEGPVSEGEKNSIESKETTKKAGDSEKVPSSAEEFWEEMGEEQYIFGSPQRTSSSSPPMQKGMPEMKSDSIMAPPSEASPPQDGSTPPSSTHFKKPVEDTGLFKEDTIERFLPFKDAQKLSTLFPSPLRGWKDGEVFVGKEILFWSKMIVAMKEYKTVSGTGVITFWLLSTEEGDLTAMLNPSVMFPEGRSAEERSLKGRRCYLFMDSISKKYFLSLPLSKKVGAYIEGENIDSHDILLKFASSIRTEEEPMKPYSR